MAYGTSTQIIIASETYSSMVQHTLLTQMRYLTNYGTSTQTIIMASETDPHTKGNILPDYGT